MHTKAASTDTVATEALYEGARIHLEGIAWVSSKQFFVSREKILAGNLVTALHVFYFKAVFIQE